MHPEAFDQRSAARLVAWALLIAVLSNGASVYLKRTGLLDGDDYRAYWSIHCKAADPARAIAPAEPRCCAHSTPEEVALHKSGPHRKLERTYASYIFETSRSGLALKLLKDLLGSALIVFSAVLIARRSAPAPEFRESWPVCLLLGYVAIEFAASVFLNGILVAAAGLRAFMFAMIALTAHWLAPNFGVIARCLGALLVLQALLIPFELFRGIHLHDHWTSLYVASRTSGTMVLPNSLGIFAVTALAFYYAFSDARGRLPLLCVAALAAVIFSGSGTGMLGAALLLLVMLKDWMGDHRRATLAMAGAFAGAAVVMAQLPVLTGREFIFDGLLYEGGRLNALGSVFTERGFLETLLGGGLGTGKIQAMQVQGSANPVALESARFLAARYGDSTITGLVVEIGVLGAALFYGALAWAGWRDRRARPFYWVVALCSLTANVTVLFPVNFLLGFAWAHSARRAPRA